MDHHHDDEVVPDSEDELLNEVVPDSEDDELLYEVVPWSPIDETTANKPCPHTLVSKRSLFRRAALETVVHCQNNYQDQGGDGPSTKREKKAIDWPSKKADITLLESLKKSDDKYDMASLYEDVKAALLDIPESLQEYQVRRRVEKLMNNYFRSFKKQKHNIDCSSSCSSHDDDATYIDKLSEEIWGEEVRNTLVHMNAQEYLDRYPRIHTSMYKLPAYSHHFKESGYDHIIDCMGFLSPKELNEMETEWADYYKGEATQELKEDVLMAAKMSDLLEKAKQLAHNTP